MKKRTLGILWKELDELTSQRDAIIKRLDKEIADVQKEINLIMGNPRECKNEQIYDDENPNYITGTEDGI